MILSSRNVCRYEILTSKDVLLEKDFLKKAATIKGIESSLLGSKLKKKKNLALQKINVSFLKFKWMLLIITIEEMILRKKMLK